MTGIIKLASKTTANLSKYESNSSIIHSMMTSMTQLTSKLILSRPNKSSYNILQQKIRNRIKLLS